MECIILAALGATLIVTRSKLFRPLRDFLKLSFFRCDQCQGFWIGGLLACFYSQPQEILLVAFSTSCLGFIVSKMFPPLRTKVPVVAQAVSDSDILNRINNLEMEI